MAFCKEKYKLVDQAENLEVQKMLQQDNLGLIDMLKAYRCAILEEHAWALLYQAAQFYRRGQPSDKYKTLYVHRSNAIRLKKDGEVVIDVKDVPTHQFPDPETFSERSKHETCEKDCVQILGREIYDALDFGVAEDNERIISKELETLIENMTLHNEAIDEEGLHSGDEGIENDSDDAVPSSEFFNFLDVTGFCTRRLTASQDANQHYKAVCRALYADVHELLTFLHVVATNEKQLAKLDSEIRSDEAANQGMEPSPRVFTLEELQEGDWARLWMQVVRQLRQGVRLKKVERVDLLPIEFELTPFEMLLEDIRSRRYSLNKIKDRINGKIPPKVKSDAHAVILDFIRSRPPLKSVKNRRLKSPPPKPPDPHENLLQDIRSMPKLRPVSNGRLVGESGIASPEKVEVPRQKSVGSDEECISPVRRVIKPDFQLFSNSFDTDDCSEDELEMEERRRVEVSQFSPLSPVSPVSPVSGINGIDPSQQRTAIQGVSIRDRKLQRRHTIMVCESPTDEAKVVQKELPPLEEDPEREKEEEVALESMGASVLFSTPLVRNGRSLWRRSHTNQNNSQQMAAQRTEQSKLSTGSLSAIPEVDDGVVDIDLSELNASELLHVNWKTACQRNSTNGHAPCKDCRPKPKKWQNPIECLNLTLEEVTHIRSVLTKAELESLISQPKLHDQVAKGKICFSCKRTRFTLFGEWGTKCKFCKRTICSHCLRKMHVPTEHFKNIPVYTLSPTPLSPETKEAIQKFVSSPPTGSGPTSPSAARKPNLDYKPGKKKPLQRSQSMLLKPPPEKVIKGPLMNICCDCKAMVTEIVRAGRTSIALINQGKEYPQDDASH